MRITNGHTDTDNACDGDIPCNGKTQKWLPAFLLIFFFAAVGLYSASISGRYKPTPDSAEYVGFAQSLARGQGYTFNGRNHSCYPPLLSLIAVKPMRLADRAGRPEVAVKALKAILCGAAVLFAAGSFWLVSYYRRIYEVVWVALLVLTNITVFQHCQYIISDMLFAALALMAVMLVIDGGGWGRWLVASVLLGLACLARSVGLFAVMGFALALLFGRWDNLKLRQRLARLAVMLPIALAGFIYWRVRYGSTDDDYIARWQYLTGKTSIVEIVWDRFVSQLSVVPMRSVQIALNIEQIALPVAFVAVIFGLILLGWGIQFIRRRALPEWVVLCYMGIMSIWFDQGPRFFLPMLPFFLIYLFTAIDWLGDRFAHPRYRARLGFIFGLMAAIILSAPLVFYKMQYGRFPALTAFLRAGYEYCFIAAILGVVLICSLPLKFPGCWRDRIKTCFFVVSVSLGVLYMTSYAIFEHGLIRSRGPMLEGYMPYYQMGQWLKDQAGVAEPVLCANASIVHLGGGKITAYPGVMTEAQIMQKIDSGQYKSVLLLNLTEAGTAEDSENKLLQSVITDHIEHFVPQASYSSTPADLSSMGYGYNLFKVR